MSQRRNRTKTSAFGVSRRENHDASPFYARFTLPAISDDGDVQQNPPSVLNQIYQHDSRNMEHLLGNSVALVVTSPPYYAGKEYEQSIGEGDVPGSYVEYLELLYEVFRECRRILEPGGRIAVNVANLGRRPYRSLAADVIEILQNRLGLLLRGEVIWVKGQAASGSCAWGSWRSPANPVLRDLTERIIIASKGRFDRAVPRTQRKAKRFPSRVSIRKDDFMAYTTDLWEFPPESAHRVNHPAPFPVELPHRLIQLYTYENDVVVDPFAGSGSTAVAAVRSKRAFVGYDTDPLYVDRARARVEKEIAQRIEFTERSSSIAVPQLKPGFVDPTDFQRRAVEHGRRAREIARELLETCDFEITTDGYRFRNGVEVNFVASDRKGNQWLFDVSGAFSSSRPGLKRTDTLWKALGKAAVIKSTNMGWPLVFLTTDLPDRGSAGESALQSTRGVLFHDAIDMFSLEGQERLRRYASGRNRTKPFGPLMVSRD